MDFRDLYFERISFLLYLCSNRRSPLGLRELKLVRKLIDCKDLSRSPLGLRESMLINCSGHDSNISLRLFGQKSIFIFGMSLVAQYSIIKY